MRHFSGALAAAVTASLVVPAALRIRHVEELRTRHRLQGIEPDGLAPLGDADWRAQNGEIIGTPEIAADGWSLERSYQDVAFYASFRCAAGCKPGVLLRAEKTADGGLKGVFVSLVEGDLASYRVTLDAQGRETTRERLRPAGGGQVRVAPPPAPAPAAAPGAPAGRGAAGGRGGGGPQPLPAAERDRVADRASERRSQGRRLERHRGRARRQHPARVPQRRRRYSGGVADEEFGRFGAFALYTGGTGEVRFKDVSFKDLQPRVAQPEEVSRRFRMQALNEFYYSWGPSVADINKDGAARHRRRPVLLPRSRLHRRARDLHGARRSTPARSTSTACSTPTTSPATAGPT